MEQIMKQHRKMFQYVEEMLYSYDRRKGDKSKNKIEYDRYAHTLRVYQWMLRITRELKDDSLDVESLKIATIFHDVGYAVQGDEGHAKKVPLFAEIIWNGVRIRPSRLILSAI